MAPTADAPSDANPAPQAEPPSGTPPVFRSANGAGLLHDRYEIYPNQPLPDLSTPSAGAFAATDRRETGRKLFALVCTPGIPVRISTGAQLRGVRTPGLLPLVEWGATPWPPLGQNCMMLIYERPMGGRAFDHLKPVNGKPRLTEHSIQRRVIEPLFQGLREMETLGLSHRAIRPDNLFFMDEAKQDLVLGDCVSAPPGFDQPLIFEPVARAMAEPGGRGEGSTADDLYALGVTLAFLLLGDVPMATEGEEALIYAKVEHGTYATLCSHHQVPLSMLEPLRGLMSDDPDERWTLKELDLWIGGRRLTPLPKRAAPKPEVRFVFAGHEHITTRTLAYAFTRYPTEAARTIKEGTPETWLRRSMGQSETADAIATATQLARFHVNTGQGTDAYLVARVSLLLDPAGPIRYKTMGFMPDAFGSALAVEHLRQGEMKTGAAILDLDIASLWATAQGGLVAGKSPLERQFARLRGFYQVREPGYGMERVLYDTNPTLPCQSSLLSQDYVVNVQELLPALDRLANRVDTKIPPVDRHIAAFVAARLETDVESSLKLLGTGSEADKTKGMLNLLAVLQWRLGPAALHNLASWVGGLLGPAINAFHSRSVRRQLEREVPRLVRKGSLPELFELIDDPEIRGQDESGYRTAVNAFAQAEAEIQDIENSDGARTDTAERIGQQAAAITSVTLTLIFVSVYMLVQFW